MNATAWVFERLPVHYVYRIQFEKVKGKRENRRIIKVMTKEGCELTGNGYSKEGEFILIFDKKLPTRGAWIEWARCLDYPLVELNSKMKPKPIKLGSYYVPAEI